MLKHDEKEPEHIEPQSQKSILLPREPKVFREGKKKPDEPRDSIQFSSLAPTLRRHASSTRNKTLQGICATRV